MLRRTIAVTLMALLAAPVAPARAVPQQPWLIPPVDGPIVRRFVPPRSDYGPGHRGIDYLVAPGTAVRAAAKGTVTFAGQVAGGGAVTIEHPDGLLTSYTWLSEVLVAAGDVVGRGHWIGRTGEAHEGVPGLHFSVRRGEYIDPAALIGEIDVSSGLSLVSLDEDLSDCAPGRALTAARRAPNDNVAVVLAGIASSTSGNDPPEVFEAARRLGYEEQRIYDFSYRGIDGDDLHLDYERTDTYGDLVVAAGKLEGLLRAIAQRHPGADVDLIAHSQGGLVARAYLEALAESWDPRLPQVEHLVAFATPHGGAPLAGEVPELGSTVLGGLALEGASAWARSGGPIPDPDSVAVRQMAPGSYFLDWLASEDVAFGTRVLALASPTDLMVPVPQASWEGATNRVVSPAGAHGAIVRSAAALATAYDFLRGRRTTCPGLWDHLGPFAGRVVSSTEGLTDVLVGAADRVVLKGLGRGLGRPLGRGLGRLLGRLGRLLRRR